MKSKLITISRTNILYLPILKLNTLGADMGLNDTAKHSTNIHVIAVDQDTQNQSSLTNDTGVLNGFMPQNSNTHIAIDQGIDNIDALNTIKIDPDLEETQYIIQIDHRLGRITTHDGSTVANYSFLDDDSIATYYMTMGSGQNTGYITSMSAQTPNDPDNSVLAGKRGSRLQFGIKASDELQNSTFLFTKLGSDTSAGTYGGGARVHSKIDTTIRIMGATTGYSMELPVRFVKYKSGGA